MQSQAFNRYFSDLYKQRLPLDRGNEPRKLMITFCGVPACGKTTLAIRLAADLHCHRVSNDDVRTLLQENNQTPTGIQVGPITRITAGDILRNNPNKVIILDSSIDRSWPGFFETAKEADAATFVIRMNCKREEIAQRLRERGRDTEYISRHEVFFEQFEICKRAVAADIELESDYVYETVLGSIKEKLATLE
jgi:dephospho-CoA kinase